MNQIANIQPGRGPGSTSRSPRRWAVAASLAAALLSLAGACAFPGQKLLVMTISRGPEVILTTQFDVVDSSSLRDIWDAAGEVPVSSEANPALLTQEALRERVAGQGSPREVEQGGPGRLKE